MPHYERTRVLPYSPDQMFDLVADVERYPEFVPGYQEVRIREHGENRLVVDQRVRFGPKPAQFSSVASLERPTRIFIRSTDSPFADLEVDWHFHAQEEGCRVDFRAGYALSAPLFNGVLEKWFADHSDRILTAFVHRARSVYGPSG